MSILYIGIFILNLILVSYLTWIASIQKGSLRVLTIVMAVFFAGHGPLILLEGHAMTECEKVGWQGGEWDVFDNEAVCIKHTADTTTKVSLRHLKEPTK